MKSYGESQRGFQLRIDGQYGFVYLMAAVVRRAVMDGDWEWVEECGVDLCELMGIDPKAFRDMMEAKRG